MSIVLNEREWAEQAIGKRELGKKSAETLSRVARYYHQVEGYTGDVLRDKLEGFLIQCDPRLIVVKWAGLIDSVARGAGKYPLIEMDKVPITSKELEVVDGIEGVQLRRLAFTLLAISKYRDSVSEKNNGWVNTADKEIMKMANINTSIKRQSAMFHVLREKGLIHFGRKVDSLSVQVLFSDDEGATVASVTDFRNVGNQYMMLCGGKYVTCAHCGVVIAKKSNAHKYCSECAAGK